MEVSFKKIAHFPKAPAHTGLTILDCRKRQRSSESHKIDELDEFSNDSSHD